MALPASSEQNSNPRARPDVGRREVHQQPAWRIAKTAIEDREAHAIARVGEGAVGQTDDGEARRARRTIGLDAHDVTFDPEHGGGESEG